VSEGLGQEPMLRVKFPLAGHSANPMRHYLTPYNLDIPGKGWVETLRSGSIVTVTRKTKLQGVANQLDVGW
jgi:hypothetical protein